MKKAPSGGFRSKPSRTFHALREELDTSQFFLVAKSGPTVFKVRDEAASTFTCIIGSPNSCTCGVDAGQESCIHLLFCLLKVLRIPDSNPLCWQITFTDSQVDMVLDHRTRTAYTRNERRQGSAPHAYLKRADKDNNKENKLEEDDIVMRQGLLEDEENVCTICQDCMEKDQALTWCRRGCGNNYHGKCMLMYATHCKSQKQNVSCPLCREDWGKAALEVIKGDCRGASSLKGTCATIFCSKCSLQQRGDFYRCIECSQNNSYKNGQLQIRKIMEDQRNTGELVVNGSNDNTMKTISRCVPTDFCEGCYRAIGREHSKHHLVIANAGVDALRDFEWCTAANPRVPRSTIESEAIVRLQERELTDDDYDLLLNLDKQELPSMTEQLLMSLAPGIVSPSGCCLCKSSGSGSVSQGTESTDGYKLLCGHIVHVNCLMAQTTAALSEGAWKLQSIKCLVDDCIYPNIYLGLSRKRKKKKDKEKDKNNEISSSTKALSPNGKSMVGFTLAGHNFTHIDGSASMTQLPDRRVAMIGSLSQSNIPIVQTRSDSRGRPPVRSHTAAQRERSAIQDREMDDTHDIDPISSLLESSISNHSLLQPNLLNDVNTNTAAHTTMVSNSILGSSSVSSFHTMSMQQNQNENHSRHRYPSNSNSNTHGNKQRARRHRVNNHMGNISNDSRKNMDALGVLVNSMQSSHGMLSHNRGSDHSKHVDNQSTALITQSNINSKNGFGRGAVPTVPRERRNEYGRNIDRSLVSTILVSQMTGQDRTKTSSFAPPNANILPCSSRHIVRRTPKAGKRHSSIGTMSMRGSTPIQTSGEEPAPAIPNASDPHTRRLSMNSTSASLTDSSPFVASIGVFSSHH
jgi:hypothetical protein